MSWVQVNSQQALRCGDDDVVRVHDWYDGDDGDVRLRLRQQCFVGQLWLEEEIGVC